MHYVPDSAKKGSEVFPSPTNREAKKTRTQTAVIAQARALTALKGLGNFTLDELCADVGIARRTFFNYFASKDDAVLGVPLRSPFADLAEDFITSAPDTTLLDALLDMLTARIRIMMHEDFTPQDMMELFVQEPALLRRMSETMRTQHTELADLIRARQGLSEHDTSPQVIAETVTHIVMHTFMQYTERAGSPRVALHDASLDLQIAVFDEMLKCNIRHLTLFFTQQPAPHKETHD